MRPVISPARVGNRAESAHPDLPLVAGALLATVTGAGGYVAAGAAVTGAASLARTAALVPWLRPDRLPPRPEAVLAEIDAWLGDHRPQTVLYFSGSKDSAHQVNMWLETMARQHSRPLVLLRERSVLDRLAYTTIPVICVPGEVHLTQMDLSSIRVALYPANAGRNIHLLRVPTMKHVFIGHGDSGESAEVNPFSKVYDEGWTAGPAGRERCRLVAVGVRDADIVEVGRPQLTAVQPWDGAPRRLPTVLYAPRWEGRDDRSSNTSLTDTVGRTRDEAEASRVSGEGRVRADVVARLRRLWNETYWRAVADSAGLGTELFRLRNTAARAATVLTPEASQIGELLEVMAPDGADPFAADRQELKECLFGPGRPGSLDRFDAATRRLVAASGRRDRTADDVFAMDRG